NTQVGKLALKLTLETTQPLANVYCPSHAVEIKKHGDHKAVIGYESDQLGEGDLKVYYSAEKPEGAVGLTLFTYRDGHADVLGSEDGYFMLLASPVLSAERKPTPKDVVFVLDTSGSMQGEKLAQAKKALRFCIENLNDDDRFQIVRFSTDAETLFDGLKPADDEHRGKANGFVDGLKPIGGTAIEEALTKAIEPTTQRDSKRPYYVIFLTDGRPTIGETDTDRILHNAITRFKAENKVRVFCFGIGTDINTKLLDKITETTRAVTEYVLPDEDIEIKVSRFYTKINEPVLANPTLAVTGDIKLQKTYPKSLPDLFAGDQLVVIGRYAGHGDAAVTLAGTVAGGEHKVVDDAAFAKQSIEHAFIPRLWATRRIGYLLDEIRLQGESGELKEEVVALARAFGVVTPYTSYLIVEDEALRNVPVAARTMQEMNDDGARRARAGAAYREMAQAEAGEASVRGAQSNASLKSAANAPAADQARIYAKRSADALDHANMDYDSATPLTQQSLYRNGKTFVLNGAQWVDTEAQTQRAQELKVERVAFNSDRYFEIVRENTDVAQWVSVGQNVQLVLADRMVEVYAE
ncbi:MAG: VWA domain-containing protein, partial [Planctomycetes bacterium]|nr:VWA domain-containing protein [Planctomycetota bacterium]